MTKISNPLPMQYLGSKARLAEWIFAYTKRFFPSTTHFLDLFSGSGTMSHCANQKGYSIIANDVQEYTGLILQSLLVHPREGLLKLAEEVESITISTLLNSGRSGARDYLQREKEFFNGEYQDWKEYQSFCKNTPVIDGSSEEISNLRSLNEWNLFWRYYANTYFGVRQSLELDSIAELANSLPLYLGRHLLAATISVMTFAVSSTTHLAQFLKSKSDVSTTNLIRRRRKSIATLVADRLRAVSNYPLPKKEALVFTDEYEEAIRKVSFTKDYVVYLDPPYFKEHYSRYYHVLETYALYDYPEMTYNDRMGCVTMGRYRSDRYVSKFGLKSEVESAFNNLFVLLKEANANIVLSYANSSLVQSDTIVKLASEVGYSVKRKKKSLMHSGQGQPRNKSVEEYLFLME